ncbi:MAG: zf-HC2 domain-containing protein [Pseudomonadota bacterium]|nr:zf-HC2 domain-containing protein [Pseudomonadota bacterium]
MNWFHSCRKVAQLQSQRLDEPLGLVDSLRLRVHLSMCDDCSNVQEQLAAVESLAAGLFQSEEPASPRRSADPDAGP